MEGSRNISGGRIRGSSPVRLIRNGIEALPPLFSLPFLLYLSSTLSISCPPLSSPPHLSSVSLPLFSLLICHLQLRVIAGPTVAGRLFAGGTARLIAGILLFVFPPSSPLLFSSSFLLLITCRPPYVPLSAPTLRTASTELSIPVFG